MFLEFLASCALAAIVFAAVLFQTDNLGLALIWAGVIGFVSEILAAMENE